MDILSLKDKELLELYEKIEEEMYRRAIFGTEAPMEYRGQIVGYVRVYSDNLTRYLLERVKKRSTIQSENQPKR